jgi:SAM-dependent methyltransferase
MNPAATSPTFRDPAGSLRVEGDRAVRTIAPSARDAVLDWLASPFCKLLEDRGDMVTSTIVDSNETLQLHHPLIPIPTFPWEWTPAQFAAAADLTLALCEEGLTHGWILKDATPLNILFLGSRPILVDVLSFERWDANRTTPPASTWLAYGQFVRTFLLPLIMLRLQHWPLALTLFKRDGYEPLDLYKTLTWPQRLSRTALWPITLPALIDRRAANSTAPKATAATTKPRDPNLSRHILTRTLTGLRKRIRRATPPAEKSEWADYTAALTHYTAAESAQKLVFVRDVLSQTKPATVLDIGANTGVFSALAASTGASVTALERDAPAADTLFRATQNQDILTLHADLARPTPAAGWDNRESSALLPRLAGQFDLVLMLAVVHHLLLMEQIPLPAILALLHTLTRRHLLLEWVPPTDPMYISLMRGRDDLYGALSESDLLAACEGRFRTLKRQPLDNGRILFLFEKVG